MQLLFTNPVDAMKNCEILVIGLFEKAELFGRLSILDQQCSGFLFRAIKSGKFSGKFGKILHITTLGLIADYENIAQVILIGLGKQSEFDFLQAEKLGAKITDMAAYERYKKLSVLLEGINEENIAQVCFGSSVKDYKFKKYKTQEKEDDEKFEIENITFALENDAYVQDLFSSRFAPIKAGIDLARNLVTEPANILNPETYVNIIKDLGKECSGLKVEILDEKMMQKLGMNALLGVARGSLFPARLAIMKWDGAENKDEKPIALVGKGVTFDTGGISLKPPKNMWDMIYDMAGSAAVVGTMYSLAMQNAKVNVVGVVGIVENMISREAQRPGDIVKSASGQTIQVLNTDAEGRLLLADALWYVQKHFKPKCIVDLATLTGAIVVALGNNYAGLFSNNDDLSEDLINAGKKANEKVWRFPLAKEYDKLIDSDVADMKNISTKGYGADSITAAQFLQRFITDTTPWAHLDIAGVAWNRVNYDLSPKGASGFGVRLLNKFIIEYSDK